MKQILITNENGLKRLSQPEVMEIIDETINMFPSRKMDDRLRTFIYDKVAERLDDVFQAEERYCDMSQLKLLILSLVKKYKGSYRKHENFENV